MSFWYWIGAALFGVVLWLYWRAGGWKSCDLPPYPKKPAQPGRRSQPEGSPDAEDESKSPASHQDRMGDEDRASHGDGTGRR